MIFDPRYDQSLWCITMGDKKNKDKIIELIQELPEELIKGIREAIAEEKAGKTPSEIRRLEGGCIAANGAYYSYQFLGSTNSALTITKALPNGDFYDSVIELNIEPSELESIRFWDAFESEDLGGLTTNIKEEHYDSLGNGCMTCDEAEYEMLHTPIVNIFICRRSIEKNDREIEFGYGIPISIKSMPGDITKENLGRRNRTFDERLY